MRLMSTLYMLVCLPACTDKNRVYEGVCRGIYDGVSQMQELNNPDPDPPPRKETLTYDQYQRAREQPLEERDK